MAAVMRRALVAAAALLLLAGCSTTTAPEPGLDPGELAAFRTFMNDNYWAGTGLSDDQRPALPPVTTVTFVDWSTAYVTCMNDAGFDQYTAINGGGYSMTDTSMNDRTDDEVIADYVCASSFEIDGQVEGVYNEQQLDYVFAYYWQILVPCLGVRGYEIVGIPTRADFVGAWGRWHPYFSVRQDQQRAFVADTRLPVDCPPMPAGIEDPGYANLWQQ